MAYNDDHEIINPAMDPSQHAWLRGELASLKAGQRAVIFCHYDYKRELSHYLRQYPIFKVLYGHSNKSCLEPEFAELDGGLWPPEDCQLLKLTPKGLDLGRCSLV